MRIKLIAILCIICVSAADAVPMDGVFCQRTDGRLNILAARVLSNGHLKFGLSKWEGSQSFTLYGVAKRRGSRWLFAERDREHVFSEEDQDWKYVGPGQVAQVTCKVTIDWNKRGSISLAVDKRMNCPGNAGYGFVEKSSRFASRDYLHKVTFELTDSDTFLSARTADGC